MNAPLSLPLAILLVAGFLMIVVLSAGMTFCVLQLVALRRRERSQLAAVMVTPVRQLEPLPRPFGATADLLPGTVALASCLTLTAEEVNRCAGNTDYVELVADDAIVRANELALEVALEAASAGTTDLSRAAARTCNRPLSVAVAVFAVCGRWPRVPGKRQVAGRG